MRKICRIVLCFFTVFLTAGMFVPLAEAQQEQTAFYAEEGAYAFSEIRYEPSPLNRVAANYAPGKAWAAHPATQNYYANTEEVHSWQYVANTWQPLTYRPGTLLVAESKDENGAASKIYKDKLGRQIMTTQAAHATRYVYDKLDRLRAVVPPGVDSPADRERCFFYNYDKRGRTIAQKTPGSGWTYAVYDGRDRKVMGADANQVDKGRWMCYTYDELNRLTRTEEVQLITPYRPDRMQYLYDYTTEMPVTERQLLIETVYDVYPFADSLAFAVNKLVTDRATHNKGRKTMERVRVLHVDPKAAAQYLTTAYYYDDRGRLVQSVADNLMEGTDRVSTAYLFSGAVDRTLQESTWLDSEERIDTLRILTTHTYDALQRPLLTIVAVNDKQPVAVSAMEYDELVRVKTKRLHGEAEAIDYGYNIRGWTARINSNLFTEELFYDQPPDAVAPRYNGDISGIRWRTARQGARAYAFTYDDLSRLIHSQFSTLNSQFSNDYTENLTYDAIGRVQTLQRYAGNNTLIDDLNYTYAGARLQTINDAATPDGLPQGITNYSYDLNGNATFEGNTRVAYNLLNLPKQVQLLGGRALRNTYAADGRKLRYEASDTRNPYLEYKTYSGNLVFDKNDNLDYILFDEGRILYNADDSTFTYEYHLKDHLGSTRVAFTPPSGAGGPVVVQENTYYPFGAPIKDFTWNTTTTNRNPYLREGKEYLATHDWNKYDFTGRTFDPWTAQALQVDPMAEKYYHVNPYAIFLNNPINVIDPTGKVADEWQYNIDTQELANIGSQGGTETQYVNVIDNNGKERGNASVNGEDVFAYNLREGVLITNYDAQIPNDYNRHSHYKYSMQDFTKRKEIMSLGYNPIQTYIHQVEREGAAEPIHANEFWALHGHSLGNWIVGSSFMKLALDIMPTGSFPNVSPKGFLFRATTSFKPAAVTTSKELSSWNQFLKANAGKYQGKGWQQKAAADYYKSNFYKGGGH